MQRTIQINDDLLIGPQPTSDTLDELQQNGIQSVLNLRETLELEQPVSPEAERKAIEGRGMFYAHVPISTDSLDEVALEQLRLQLHHLPKPVYLHSWTGQRAVIAAALCLAVEHAWSGEETLEHIESLGVECSEEMARFIRAYVDQRPVPNLTSPAPELPAPLSQ